jgi:hypothetical protein
VEAVRLAVEGGCTIVQLREKDIDGVDFVAAAKAVLQVGGAARQDGDGEGHGRWRWLLARPIARLLPGRPGDLSLAPPRLTPQVCRPKGVPVIINDRIDVALAAGADGVHLGQSDIPAAAARQLLGPSKIIGISVKTPEEARQAQADGARPALDGPRRKQGASAPAAGPMWAAAALPAQRRCLHCTRARRGLTPLLPLLPLQVRTTWAPGPCTPRAPRTAR